MVFGIEAAQVILLDTLEESDGFYRLVIGMFFIAVPMTQLKGSYFRVSVAVLFIGVIEFVHQRSNIRHAMSYNWHRQLLDFRTRRTIESQTLCFLVTLLYIQVCTCGRLQCYVSAYSYPAASNHRSRSPSRAIQAGKGQNSRPRASSNFIVVIAPHRAESESCFHIFT